MIHGQYRDVVYDRRVNPTLDSGWSSNTIVDTSWPLIAGLLKNDPGLGGILFLAVGAGDPSWDATHAAAGASVTQLQKEIDRLAVPAGDIEYLDPSEKPVTGPTTRILVSTSLTWPGQDQTLREFGLFGGDATGAPDSGHLINYVIHPRIDLSAGATLTRKIRLSLRPDIDPWWLDIPQHWLSAVSVQDLDGVGSAYAATLETAGVQTIGELVSVEPATTSIALPLMKLVELRAKALLTLRAAGQLSPVSGLLDRTAWEVITTPTATLVADAGATVELVQRLREQVSALQLTLDNRFLQRVTIGELAQPL